MDLTYTAPQARRVRKLATRDEFIDDKGGPRVAEIAAQVGLSRDATRYILDGEKALPEDDEESRGKSRGKPRAPRVDPLS